MSKCKGCGAQIIWVKTDSGSTMPIDPVPEKRVIIWDAKGTFLVGPEDPTHIANVQDAWVPHWATCPKADDFRNKGKEEPVGEPPKEPPPKEPEQTTLW